MKKFIQCFMFTAITSISSYAIANIPGGFEILPPGHTALFKNNKELMDVENHKAEMSLQCNEGDHFSNEVVADMHIPAKGNVGRVDALKFGKTCEKVYRTGLMNYNYTFLNTRKGDDAALINLSDVSIIIKPINGVSITIEETKHQ